MPWTDGQWMVECPKCEGLGHSVCPTCGQNDGECVICEGSGEIHDPNGDPEQQVKENKENV